MSGFYKPITLPILLRLRLRLLFSFLVASLLTLYRKTAFFITMKHKPYAFSISSPYTSRTYFLCFANSTGTNFALIVDKTRIFWDKYWETSNTAVAMSQNSVNTIIFTYIQYSLVLSLGITRLASKRSIINVDLDYFFYNDKRYSCIQYLLQFRKR